MKNLNYIFNLLFQYFSKLRLFALLLFFLIFSSTHLYAVGVSYVDNINEPIILTSTGYDDITHEASKNDLVYYMFKLDEAGDVTITVNDIVFTDTDTPRFDYNMTDYPDLDWDTGSTTETFTGMAKDDTIYVGVLYDSLNTPQAAKYGIVVTLTPAASLDSNLTITKTGSNDIVTIDRDFYYTINVTNTGVNVASDINVTDILPSGVDFNATETNDNSPYWNCSEAPAQTITCEHNTSNISAGETHTIFLHVTAPSTPGEIENNATVSGTINAISHSATASETTVISDDIDNAENVCYIENSVENYGNNYTLLEAACDKKGNFYYGQGCNASIIIVDTDASEDSILELTVSKMYAPGLDHGTASATFPAELPAGNGPSSLNITEYSSYTEGYVVYNAELTNDHNFTITDYNSYNNGGKLYGIALYADYNITGVHHSGRIYACNGTSEGNIEITTAADIIDTPIGNSATTAGYYNASIVPNPVLPSLEIPNTNIKYIQTMIAGSNRQISGVHLDLGGTATVWDYNGSETTLPYSVIPYLTDDSCTASLGNIIDSTGKQLIIDIPEGQYSANGTMIVSSTAIEVARIQTSFVDPNGLSVEGQNCLASSSLTGNFARLAQCTNSEIQYKTAFGQDAWDRCGTGNGSPCESANHGYSCGPGDTSCSDYNQIYDNELGCYMCTFNYQASCSTDNFAIRPDDFNSTIVPNQIFTAGVSTSLTFRADQFGGTGTPEYNEVENTSFVVDVNISDSSKSCQDMSINFDPTIDFTDGIVTDNYSLPNVGDFNVTMHETIGSEFALVDADDTDDTDRLITQFTQQIKVIPDHFAIDGNFTNGSDGFTYLNNFEANATLDQNISALMNWNVIAETEGNVTTTNYTSTCYAKDGNISLTLDLGAHNIGDINDSLSKLLWYDDENGTIIGSVSINNPLILPNYTAQRFESGDSNGTGNFRYRLNFDRNVTKVVNPFRMAINNLAMTDTDSVTGNNALDNNATYIYGRTHASKQRYQGDEGTANIYFESYCFGTTCTKTLLNGFSPNLNRTDDIRWFYNEGSHITLTDGNIGTVQEKDATPLDATDDVVDVTDQRNNLNPSEADLDYDESSGYPYITTMHNDASPWLIYNEYDSNAIRNEFQVHFLSESDWTGENETDVTTKKDANVITNRRSMW